MTPPSDSQPESRAGSQLDASLFGRAADLFDELADLSAEGQQERITEIEAGDPALAAEVRELLAADAAAGTFFDDLTRDGLPTIVAAAAGDLTHRVEPGDLFGVWRLERLLGQGGMGDVWEVARADGSYEAKAALKLLRRGLDSESIAARFRAERQILARLAHPAIAKLLDGGVAPDGRPFLVMEKVTGTTITRYCVDHDLAIAERVRLIRVVCDAVDSAHRALIVHRDLKPSNVLVTTEGDPKLLDFGIAKLLDPEGNDDATRLDERLLTPAYAAPEQILGEPITTATDVYALGILLFQVLTGELPHQRTGTSLGEIVANVSREQTPRPSRVARRSPVDGDGAIGGAAAAQRLRLSRRLRGDLDAITTKALEHEPARRYRSAAEMGLDLERYLRGLPVEARPSSFTYRASRFVRRHRAAVAAGALGLIALIGGLVVSLIQTERAQHEARRAGRARDVLVSILEGADPDNARGREVTVRELLAQSGPRIEAEVADDPELRDQLLLAIARVEGALGHLEVALPRAQQAWNSTVERAGVASDEAAAATVELAGILTLAGEFAEAKKQLELVLERQQQRFGRDSLEAARVAIALGGVLEQLGQAELALPMVEHAVAILVAEIGETHVETFFARATLAALLDSLDRIDEAVALYRVLALDAAARFGDSPQTYLSYQNLAVGLLWAGQNAESELWFVRAIEGLERVLGPDHPRLAFTRNQYSNLLTQIDRDDEADAENRAAMKVFEAMDPDHPEVANGWHSLAISALRRDAWEEADRQFSEAIAIWDRTLGPDHPSGAMARSYRGLARAHLGRFEAGRADSDAALALLDGSSGGRRVNALRAAGEIERLAGKIELAREIHEDALAQAIEIFGAGHPIEVGLRVVLATTLIEDPRTSDDAVLEQIQLARAALQATDPASGRLAACLLVEGRVALRQGDHERALGLFEAARAQVLLRQAATHPRVIEADQWIARAQE